MITLNKYIETLIKLQKLGLGECVMIYSVDDEGNAYHKIHNYPSTESVEDIEEHYLELSDTLEKPNTIIIN